MTDQPPRTFEQGVALGQLLGQFRAAHPKHQHLSDADIMSAADAIAPEIAKRRLTPNSADHIEAGSSRHELFEMVDGHLSEDDGSIGSILDQRKKTGMW